MYSLFVNRFTYLTLSNTEAVWQTNKLTHAVLLNRTELHKYKK